MIVGDRARVETSFATAQARLADLARGGLLPGAAQDAYAEGITYLVRVGPLGSAPGLSKVIEVQYRDLIQRADTAVLTLRWQATGRGGGLFPVLDADITLSPDGECATILAISGAYRPPLGTIGAGLDRAILHRAAAATIHSFACRIADAIAHPKPALQPQT
jgi:hypothetical protein